jgi:hypothetical protein
MVLLVLILQSGCEKKDRYAIEQGKDGRIYRLDRETGEMVAVSGDKLIAISTPESQIIEKKLEADLAEEKYWSDQTIPAPANLKCKLKTSWREGRMYYIFSIYPLEQTSVNAEGKQLEASSAKASRDWEWLDQYNRDFRTSITIHMNDKGSFKLADIHVPFYTVIRIVNAKGEPSHIQGDGTIYCTSEMYKAFNDWSLTWNLEKKVIVKDTKQNVKKKRVRY